LLLLRFFVVAIHVVAISILVELLTLKIVALLFVVTKSRFHHPRLAGPGFAAAGLGWPWFAAAGLAGPGLCCGWPCWPWLLRLALLAL
jgi:hypothetical protein